MFWGSEEDIKWHHREAVNNIQNEKLSRTNYSVSSTVNCKRERKECVKPKDGKRLEKPDKCNFWTLFASQLKKKKAVKEIISKNLLYNKGNSPQYSVIRTWEKTWKRIDVCLGFPGGSDGKESTFSKRDLGLIPGLGRDGYLLQYSFLENFMDRGAWRATVHGVTESQTRLSSFPTQIYF